MDLRQLRYLIATVDGGGIRRASRQLYLTQPAISKAVAPARKRAWCRAHPPQHARNRAHTEPLGLSAGIGRGLAHRDITTTRWALAIALALLVWTLFGHSGAGKGV